MTIDISTLHIGSHVLYNGKRERVRGLDEDNGLIIRFPAEYVLVSEVEPILLTKQLLTELGFLKMEEHGLVSVWLKRNIRIDFYDTRIVAMVGNENDYTNRCTISPIHYLHELEAFLYLTTKTELIKE